MNFTDQYTQADKKMVTQINAELVNRDINPSQAGAEFNDSLVPQILAGTCKVAVQPRLNYMFESLFGDAKADDVAAANANFTDSYTADDIALCEKIKAAMSGPKAKAKGRTAANLSKQLNMAASMFSQVVNGNYKASPSEHLQKIWATLSPDVSVTETTPAEKIIIRYGDIPYIDTSISNLIRLTCQNAKLQRRFTVFAGQAGLGKSMGIKRYCEDNPDSIALSGGEMVSAPEIVNQLCTKLGISKTFNNATKTKNIILTLKETGRVIILDEADKVKPSALHPLRTISDEAKIGVALIGNLKLVEKLNTLEAYELIHSRVTFNPKPVSKIKVADTKALFEQLTKGQLPLSEDGDEWWAWLHKRTDGKARTLVESLLPHLLKFSYSSPNTPITRHLVNEVFSSALNSPAM